MVDFNYLLKLETSYFTLLKKQKTEMLRRKIVYFG